MMMSRDLNWPQRYSLVMINDKSRVLDENNDRVVEAVDDLGDPKDNSACMLVQTRAQPHLLLTMSMSFR